MPPGSIQRLVLLAGPSGAGKSAFLRDPSHFLDRSSLPSAVRDLFELAPHWRPIEGMANRSGEPLDSVCVHLDLNFPLRQLAPESRDDLLLTLKPQLYEDWRELRGCLDSSEVADVITFHVRREIHFQRWLYEKRFPRNPGGGVLNTMVAINGDSSNGDELHGAAYRAWFDFVAARRVRSHSVLDVSTEQYRFLTADELQRETDWPVTA